MAQSPPRLRDDLTITLLSGDDGGYVIEDPLRNVFFKIGRREYLFLCSLNRGDNLSKLPEDASIDDSDGQTVTREEALTILKWLGSKQLLQNQDVETLEAIESAEGAALQKNWLARMNLISFRIPLFNPDPFLCQIRPWLGWLAGPLFFAVWLLLAVVSLGALFVNWQSFINQSASFFSFGNMIILGLIWLLLKLLHELFHALVCNRYGGQVFEMGILFILFIPLTYVNASSSWSFPTRWQRIHVALAGMYIELFVAWLAILYWVTHGGTPTGLLAHNTVLVAGVSSLLFNANPLMRFDGYYVLSDLVNIPNLYFRGLASVRRLAKKIWLGIEEPESIPVHSNFVAVYGGAVYLWRILVLFSLGYGASKMFSGWGLILTIIAALGWVSQPIISFVTKFAGYRTQNPRVLSHFASRAVVVGLISGFLLFGVDWEKNVTVPAVVLFEEQHSIRTASQGFVDQILIHEGDLVESGQPLLKLVNGDLESSARELELEIGILDLKRRLAISSGTHAELQMLDQQNEVLQKRKRNLDADLKGLFIHAPGSGMVVGHDLESLLGIWVHKGEELFQVVSPENKHLVASVDQDDISSFSGRTGEKVQIDMTERGLGVFSGSIEKVAPTASRELLHPSLAAFYGGPFDVKPASTADGEKGLVLFSPRFSIAIQLPDDIKQELRSGQQARIQIKGSARTPAHVFWTGLRNWFLARRTPH
ncbi:MAG TPA: HlyD family efflux transporter periplasmic adaptor subunit [Desulfobacterales bacterium]|nr:HlyD family efflux transporter periplasmic adaptor subunit [Desulfobacterales bacterium]HIP38515.1 HlyD family efflux transporter periplasmic adaptor subunit [Desulfocapsa sulfexigens]